MDDYQAYLKFVNHRKWFNKLWLSEKMQYNCGPCGIAPNNSGWYIVRPIYNLSGMSLGASKLWIPSDDYSRVPPGYFWCQWFEGTQTSTTYRWSDGQWVAQHCWKATRDHSNLSKFVKWQRNSNRDQYKTLPSFFNQLSDVKLINVEHVGDKIIEVHLRDTPDPCYDEIVPIWSSGQNEVEYYTKLGYKWVSSYEDADGFLHDPRLGFMVKNY